MYQNEFMSLSKNIERYATYEARRYIHDESQRMTAIDEAIAKFIDNAGFYQEGHELLSPIGGYNELLAWGKVVVRNSLKNYAKKKKELKPIPCDEDGFHGMELYG